jgi:hypothetical protein
MTPEGRIVQAILDYLWVKNIYAWQNRTGATKIHRQGYTDGFIRFGKPGSADILGVTPDGRFLAIECKTATGRVTPMQAEFLEDIRRSNGVAFVARSVEDVIAKLEEA